jgi:hypothetical protein
MRKKLSINQTAPFILKESVRNVGSLLQERAFTLLGTDLRLQVPNWAWRTTLVTMATIWPVLQMIFV